jgi:hypothetical protein
MSNESVARTLQKAMEDGIKIIRLDYRTVKYDGKCNLVQTGIQTSSAMLALNSADEAKNTSNVTKEPGTKLNGGGKAHRCGAVEILEHASLYQTFSVKTKKILSLTRNASPIVASKPALTNGSIVYNILSLSYPQS